MELLGIVKMSVKDNKKKKQIIVKLKSRYKLMIKKLRMLKLGYSKHIIFIIQMVHFIIKLYVIMVRNV